MEWYHKGLETIIRSLNDRYISIWIIIYSNEIVIQRTGVCNKYVYIKGRWTKITYPEVIRTYYICHHKMYELNTINNINWPRKCTLNINLSDVKDVYYVTDLRWEWVSIKDDTWLNPDNVLAELQSRLERPKMTTFWISDLLIKYE